MKVRSDFITNSSSSSFICIKCGKEIIGWDWEPEFDREMCGYCYNDLSEKDRERVDNGTYISESKSELLDFIDFICDELCLDEQKVLTMFNEWRKNK